MLQMLDDYEKKELCHLMYLGFAGCIPEIHDLNIPCPICLVVGENDKTRNAWDVYSLFALSGMLYKSRRTESKVTEVYWEKYYD